MKIGRMDTDKRILIVAEIGNNHEGNPRVAEELVRRAADCGVDAVKFQTYRTEHFINRSDITRFNRLKSFEMSFGQFEELSHLAHSLHLLFMSTPLDLGSADFLTSIVDAFKIASGDNDFYPLLGQVARTGKPIIVSSGASDFAQVKRTVEFVRQEWDKTDTAGQLAVLHCVSQYPADPTQVNLRAVRYLADNLPCTVGFSDHTIGTDAAFLAIALGARIIEKHFTLDTRFSEFRDHQISADPTSMKVLVERIRLGELLLGESHKRIQRGEAGIIDQIRRAIVAATPLTRGQLLRWNDLAWLRPAAGLAPGNESHLVGKVLRRDLAQGDPILATDLECPSPAQSEILGA